MAKSKIEDAKINWEIKDKQKPIEYGRTLKNFRPKRIYPPAKKENGEITYE